MCLKNHKPLTECSKEPSKCDASVLLWEGSQTRNYSIWPVSVFNLAHCQAFPEVISRPLSRSSIMKISSRREFPWLQVQYTTWISLGLGMHAEEALDVKLEDNKAYLDIYAPCRWAAEMDKMIKTRNHRMTPWLGIWSQNNITISHSYLMRLFPSSMTAVLFFISPETDLSATWHAAPQNRVVTVCNILNRSKQYCMDTVFHSNKLLSVNSTRDQFEACCIVLN